MFEINITDGTLSIPAIGFAGGIVRFSFDRCSIGSDQVSWKRSGMDVVATVEGLELTLTVDEAAITSKAKNTSNRAIRLNDVTVEFHPSKMKNAPASDDFLELINSVNMEPLSGVKRVGLPNRWL